MPVCTETAVIDTGHCVIWNHEQAMISKITYSTLYKQHIRLKDFAVMHIRFIHRQKIQYAH